MEYTLDDQVDYFDKLLDSLLGDTETEIRKEDSPGFGELLYPNKPKSQYVISLIEDFSDRLNDLPSGGRDFMDEEVADTWGYIQGTCRELFEAVTFKHESDMNAVMYIWTAAGKILQTRTKVRKAFLEETA